MTGTKRIESVFSRARSEGRAAFMPYHPLGYPTRQASIEAVKTLARSGADLFEIGIPFSDPLADGPMVQAATQQALEGGTTVADCLAIMKELRQEGVEQPFCAMTYYNPILAYGEERFVTDAVESGVDGLIVPDLPPGESDRLEDAADDAGLACVYMLAPTSTEGRIDEVLRRARGFIYLVSVAGITGERQSLPPDLVNFVARVRKKTELPLAVGFGIATGDHAAEVASLADGVIVGSALVRAAGGPNGNEAVRSLALQLSQGCRRGAVRSRS